MFARTHAALARSAAVLLLPAALAAGLLAADPLPVAPPPREAKPTEAKIDPALLIGKWELTKLNGFPSDGRITATVEFGADGALFIRAAGVKDRERLQEGTYHLDGQRLHFTTAGAGTLPRSWSVSIEKLAAAELVFREERGSKDLMGFTKLRQK